MSSHLQVDPSLVLVIGSARSGKTNKMKRIYFHWLKTHTDAYAGQPKKRFELHIVTYCQSDLDAWLEDWIGHRDFATIDSSHFRFDHLDIFSYSTLNELVVRGNIWHSSDSIKSLVVDGPVLCYAEMAQLITNILDLSRIREIKVMISCQDANSLPKALLTQATHIYVAPAIRWIARGSLFDAFSKSKYGLMFFHQITTPAVKRGEFMLIDRLTKDICNR